MVLTVNRYTSNDTIDLLTQIFSRQIIFWNGDVNWPPRSFDFTYLDYFIQRLNFDNNDSNSQSNLNYMKNYIYINVITVDSISNEKFSEINVN